MNHNSNPTPVFKALLISVVCTILAVTTRIVLTFTSLDVNYGVYKHDSIAPTVFHIILAAVCAVFILFSILKAPKLSANYQIPTDNLTVFTSLVAAFLLAARVFALLWWAVQGLPIGKLGYFEILFALISVIYFLGLALNKNERSPILAAASFFPIGWCAICLISLYFDTSILMTSPNKMLGLVALLAAMIYFLCEVRFQTSNVSHRFYLAAASVSPLLLLTSAIPNVVCFDKLAVGASDDLIRYAAEFALGLFIYARLFAYARSIKEISGGTPENNM